MPKNTYKYTITQKLLANIKRIAALVTELNNKQFPNVIKMEFERRARELSAYSSTSIEGNPLPLTEVKKILKNKPKNLRDSEKEVVNYNQALEKLNSQPKARLSLKLILEIQKDITKGLLDKYRCGYLRQEPVFVNNPRSGKTVYWPPDHQNVKPLMEELINFISRNKDNIDSLILAGIFHKQFVTIHPFIDGNGRTARLATKVLLAAMGLNTFNLFSFENYYNRNVGKYFEKVGVLGNYYDLKKELDFTPWLEYFTDGIIDELLRVKKELEKEIVSPETALKAHHKQIIKYIGENGYITDKIYSTITKRAKPTRNIDLNKLIKLGLIEKKGKGKATYYQLKK